ncbi:multiple sugar transport system ATP-binding protein [Halogranum rubrum]|uniref:ABC-type D-xylose/L-arabinose transporter n=1 Tax=Halogranum rubrum TaxID=553466 RepID=A0A1I4JQJ3_9EURY|nr:ABC transporter ATP-binding protein [Halogranum rubrum]SFL68800.1 multiple sugar transport system ATP-binding protein [Halogranum rubrum]
MSQTTSTANSITIDTLRKEFNTPDGTVVAVDSIHIEIGPEEFLTLVGPSGCGKTTTLRCLAGLETPTSGEIRLGNRDVSDLPANKRDFAMMFQNIALYPHMKIIDNIAYPLKVRGVSTQERHEHAKEAAEIMQITDLLNKYPGEVSGGQRQRAALARTVVQNPKAFLMDEPLSDLDAKLKVEIRKEIQRVHQRVKRPTVYVTHDQEEAMTMSDRIAVMNNGGIEQIGTPNELYNEPANLFVAQFIGNPSMNFADGTVETVSTDGVSVSVDERIVDLSLNAEADLSMGDEVVLGFRPETVSLDTAGPGFEGEITLIERIDDRMLATVEGDLGEIRATVSADDPLNVGDVVPISFDTSHIHVFDRDTGEHIASGDRPSTRRAKRGAE